MNVRYSIVALIPQLIVCASVSAQETPDIHIRGSAADATEKVREQLGDVSSFSQREIEAFLSPSTDSFLKQVPGFTLYRRLPSAAAHPTTQGVSLRGVGPTGASRSLVLLDGVPLNDTFGGWVSWARIPITEIGRIRVQENWGSNHFSALGLGSVIELESGEVPLANEDVTSDVEVFGGSEDTASLGARAGISNNKLHARANAHHFTTGGYRVVAPEDRGPIDIPGDSTHTTGNTSVRYELQQGSIWASASGFDEDRGNGTALTENGTSIAQISTGLRARAGSGTAKALVFATKTKFASKFSAQSDDRTSEIPALDQFDVPANEVGVAADWFVELNSDRQLEIGADVLFREGQTKENFRFIDDAFQQRRETGADQTLFGTYASYRMPIGKAVLDTFLRADIWQKADVFLNQGAIDNRSNEFRRLTDDDTIVLLSPRVQLRTKLSDRLVLRTALTRGARAPTINELVRPFRVRNDITGANPELREERVIGSDLALEYRYRGYEAVVTPFLNYLENPIVSVTVNNAEEAAGICGSVPAGGICRQRQNLSFALVAGLETKLAAELSAGRELSASYLLADSEIWDFGPPIQVLAGARVRF